MEDLAGMVSEHGSGLRLLIYPSYDMIREETITKLMLAVEKRSTMNATPEHR